MMLQSCGARSPAQASRSPAVCHRRGTSPVTWSSAIASGRRADSAERRASVDGFPPLGGAPSTSASSHYSAMRASVDGFLPLLTSKRRRACSSFDDRHNVSSKERSAGTQAVACQALWVIYDRCHTWIRSSAMAGKARRPRTGRQRYIAYRLMSAKPQRCTLHTKKCSPEDVSFTPAAPAKNTASWPQGGSKTETARRPQKKDRQRILF